MEAGREANLPAQSPQTQANPRIPQPDAHARRPEGPQPPEGEGPAPADGIARAAGPLSADGAVQTGRLASSEQIRLVYREGRRFSDELLVVYVKPNGMGVRRMAVSVSGRAGGAVVRNRLKRRIREASRRAGCEIPEGTDVVVVARTAAAAASYQELQASLGRLAARSAAGSSRPGDT